MATKGKNTDSASKGKKRAREIDFSLVTLESIPSYSQRELREIAKHFGIRIPRTKHSQPAIAEYLQLTFEQDPLILKEKLREDKSLTAEQWTYVRQLCNMLATPHEIANFFGLSIDQLQKACYNEYQISFTDFYDRESTNGKISLRRAQMQSALGAKAVYDANRNVVKAEQKPSIPMQIYLGKVLLGQVEPKEAKGKDDADAITMDKLTEILLEEQGDGVFGESAKLKVAYDTAKGVKASELRDSNNAKGGLED